MLEESDSLHSRKRGRPKQSSPKLVETTHEIQDQSYDTDDEIDPVGEEKVTKDGYLLGGREYKFQTFTLPHSKSLFMYALDVSKILGFRDAYIFFIRNPKVVRVTGTEEDREHLRSLGILPSALKNRPITMIRARNLFKCFGHLIIRRGRPVRDDYFVGDNIEPPYTEPENMDDNEVDKSMYLDGPFRRNGLSVAGFPHEFTDSFVPTIPTDLAKDEWMLKCAQSAAEFNHRQILINSRLNRTRPTSFLDLHTNIEQVCQRDQPKRVVVQAHKNNNGQLQIESEFNFESRIDPDWTTVGSSSCTNLYPVAIMKDQHVDQIPLFPIRFSTNDVAKHLPRRIEPYDMLPNLAGVQPFIPLNSSNKKRHRQAKV